MAEIISKATRRIFQESYVKYAVLREIANDFDDAGVIRGNIPPDRQVYGERRTLVEEYYSSVDWTSPRQVRRVLDAYESHLLRLIERKAIDEFNHLLTFIRLDHLQYANGKIVFTVIEAELDDLVDHKISLDISQLKININRIKNAVEDDPALAIGSAKELVEATCKAILTEKAIPYQENVDLPELIHMTITQLQLIAANVSDVTKGAKSIRRVLGSLANIVQGLSELRNLYGSGHGKSPGKKGLSPRHARLCASAASTLALFLMETAKDREIN